MYNTLLLGFGLVLVALVLVREYRMAQRFTVLVHGGDFHGRKHHSTTYADALAWAACYPQHMRTAVYIRKGAWRWVGKVK